MAHYLRFDGVEDYVQLAESVNLSGHFKIVIDVELSDVGDTKFFDGDNNPPSERFDINVDSLGNIDNRSYCKFFIGGTQVTNVAQYENTRIELEIKRDATDIDQTLKEFTFIGTRYSEQNFLDGKLYKIEVYDAADTLMHHYNPTVSAEAGGTLLIDEVGGNHGTLNGYVAYPFVYYYDFLNPSDEDTTNDNCLVLPENRPNGEQLDLVAGANNSREFDLRIVWSQSDICLMLGATSSSPDHLAFRYGGDTIRLGMNWLTSTFTLNNNFNNYTDLITLEFKLTANTLTAKQDGVALAETFDVGTKGFKLPVEAFRTSAAINLHSFSFISHDFPEDSRFYDFNRSPATAPIVPELINGQNGLMVGFPEPSGYVKDASNAIVGYRFNTDTSAKMSTGLPALDGATDFAIEVMVALDDNLYAVILSKIDGNSFNNYIRVTNSEVRFNGIDNASRNTFLTSLFADKQLHKLRLERSANGDMVLLVDDVLIQTINNSNAKFSALAAEMGAFMSGANGVSSSGTMQSAKIEAPVSTVIAQFNFTTGDDDEIINTVGNNATIINAPTAGYLPIIEKQVFTVGAGKDYPSAGSLMSATASASYIVEGVVYGNTGETANIDIIDRSAPVILSAATGEEFDLGSLSGARIGTASIRRRNSDLTIRDLILKNLVALNPNNKQTDHVERCFFDGRGLGGSCIYLTSPQVTKSHIKSCVSIGYSDPFAGDVTYKDPLKVYDSLVISASRWGLANCTGYNNIVYDCTVNGALGSNNIGDDSSITTIGTQLADINTAFNDSANDDYRILQTYADTNLVGQGWNGSDIGASFYFDGSTPPVSATDTVKVLRGSTIIADGQTALTLQNGVDYTLEDTDDSKWYFRITNNHFTGMGTTSGGGNQRPNRITVHAVQSGADVILNRPSGTNDNRVDWEIIQYSGNTPENEFVVREKGNITLVGTELTQTVSLPSSVVNADDVVILITSQSTSSGSNGDAAAGLFTAVRGATDWLATRGKSNGTANLSYAVIEYTGSDYTVTQESFTASTNVDTHTLVTPVADAAQTFIHAHYRYDSTGAAGLDDASVRVYLQDENTISIHNDTSTDLALKQHHVYLIQNPNLTVQRVTGEMAGAGEEEIHGVAITTVADLELTSLGGLSASSTGSGTAFPRGFINFTLENDSSVMLRQSDNGQTSQYAFEVIEWPAGDGDGDGGGGDTVWLFAATLNFGMDLVGTYSKTANVTGEVISELGATTTTTKTVNVEGAQAIGSDTTSVQSKDVGVEASLLTTNSIADAFAKAVNVQGSQAVTNELSSQFNKAMVFSARQSVGLTQTSAVRKTANLDGSYTLSMDVVGTFEKEVDGAKTFSATLSVTTQAANAFSKEAFAAGGLSVSLDIHAAPEKSAGLDAAIGVFVQAASAQSKATTLSGAVATSLDVLSLTEKTAILLSELTVDAQGFGTLGIKDANLSGSVGQEVTLSGFAYNPDDRIEYFDMRFNGSLIFQRRHGQISPVMNIRAGLATERVDGSVGSTRINGALDKD